MIKTVYLRNGRIYKPSSPEALDMHEKLPAGIFTIGQDQYGNLFFDQIDDFPQPSKLYGTTTKDADRILNTFKSRSASTGVMLNGEKGSGKTLLAKIMSIKAMAEGIPTIVINAPWCGDQFNKLIQSITQPAIIMFDEFEKVYDEEKQESILTLLDGVYPSKKLFILTCNNKWRVDQHMRNRPGRIFYMLDFKGLEPQFVREYCQDNLANQDHVETVVKVSGVFDQFNFDMLKALVEEMNRYDETPQEALRMLNAKPEGENSGQYEVEMIKNGVKLEGNMYPDVYTGNPLGKEMTFQVYPNEGTPSYRALLEVMKEKDPKFDDESDSVECSMVFTPDNLKSLDADAGVFRFERDGDVVILTRKRAKMYNYYDAF